MKIAVIGAGAIGSIVAAYLAKAGEDILLIGRQDQVKAIQKDGLKIKGARQEEIFNLKAATQLKEKCDLVIFAVKTQDLEAAYQHNHEYLENPLVLTTQNGVQADSMLSVHFDREKVHSSIVMFGATYIKPGEVIFNFEGDWIVGKPFSPVDPTTHMIADTLRKAFKVVVSDEIVGMKWLKLFVNFNNCLPALVGKSMQETFADLDMCRLSVKLLKEGVGIVEKAQINLVSLPQFPKERIIGLIQMPQDQAAGILQQTLTKLSKEPLYGSILQSIMRQRASEIDFINGEVVQMAKQIRSRAIMNERIVEMVHKVERQKKFFSIDEVKKEFQLSENQVQTK